MLEFNWKLNQSVYRNLLKIKGISSTTANKLCGFIGISINTLYSDLLPHKLDQLNLLLSFYKKRNYPFNLNSITDLDPHYSVNHKLSSSHKKAPLSPLASPIELALDEYTKSNIVESIKLNTYKGRRFKYGYPVHGQRTRCNARTARKLNRLSRINVSNY